MLWKKWHCGRVFSEYFGFSLVSIIPPVFHFGPNTTAVTRHTSGHGLGTFEQSNVLSAVGAILDRKGLAYCVLSFKSYTAMVNPLTPGLNPYAQHCLTRFFTGVLLLEPCTPLIYA
jgi:hypothetical protein